ncbi:The GLUG motif-containing protein [Fibrobacter intestinalis]|uniref:The GLUG motif-containing protein n=1 Tax=Fibrobacter intestinalis TaxID=28122 RepID=A0A1M6SPC5_9BACT|nr:GLUG motif-containing protein [Fibrobacter intestinalis]SHK46487.1 The GLUG motif-containing protein [Fibrobacter intestinalis]
MKIFKTLLLFLALLAPFCFGAAWTGGTSEPRTRVVNDSAWYVITTPEELAWFAAQVNGWNYAINAMLENDIVFGSDTATVNTAYPWTPIGYYDNTRNGYFNGVLDGQGRSIYGIYTDSTVSFGGLVGFLNSSGVIRNVNMKRDSINSKYYSGGIVAYNKGQIINCTNSGSVSSYASSSYSSYYSSYSGGIAGNNDGAITDCTNSGIVYSTTPSNSYSGGIAGYNYGTVTGCTNSGTIDDGGIVGYNYGTVSYCTNSGSATGYYSAGIVKENSVGGTITNCFNNCMTGSCPFYGISDYKYSDRDIIKNSYSVIYSESSGFKTVVSFNNNDEGLYGFTTAQMQTAEFAWQLNTTNGTEENSGVWSFAGSYPVFASSKALPSYRIVFDTRGDTTSRFTNYKGKATFPSNSEAGFLGWFTRDGVQVGSNTVFLKDTEVWAAYEDLPLAFLDIRFFNADGTQLDSQSVRLGNLPSYGKTPTLPATAKYTFAFKSWSSEIVAATQNFDYFAVYDSTINTYTVTFRTESEIIDRQTVAYGDSARTPAKIPSQAGSRFTGWSPSYSYITGNLTVIAQFEEAEDLCLVRLFVDGSPVDSLSVDFNESFTLPEAPTSDNDFAWFDEYGVKLGEPGESIVITDNLDIFWKKSSTPVSSSSSALQSSSSVTQSSSSIVSSSSSAVQSSSSVEPSSSSVTPSSSSVAQSSSSAVQSSSSIAQSSSSVQLSSSSAEPSSSSSEDPDALHFSAHPRFNLHVQNRTLQIQNARIGSAFAVLDLQGRVLRRGVVNSPEFSIELQNAGAYIVRIDSQVQKIRVK